MESAPNGTNVAEQTSKAVGGLSQFFMLDPAMYSAATDKGFSGIDFYFSGRAGVLGDVEHDVVTSTLVFFNPDTVRAGWTGSRDVMPRPEAVECFAGSADQWAREHLGDDVDWSRLAELAGKIVDDASAAGAPLFAGWRKVELPEGQKEAALRQMNALRELRMARHGNAVVAVGLDPADAVRFRTPYMTAIFGWEDGEPADEVGQLWREAEALTNRATERDYAVLSTTEAEDFVALSAAAMEDTH